MLLSHETEATMTDKKNCTLIYAEDGFSWVRYGALNEPEAEGDTLTSETNPKAKYPTLMAAFQAAVRAGHDPTHWTRPGSGVPLPLDHADHWRKTA